MTQTLSWKRASGPSTSSRATRKQWQLALWCLCKSVRCKQVRDECCGHDSVMAQLCMPFQGAVMMD